MKSFTDKVIIITGGGKGIGRETAKLLASHQSIVIITGRSKAELEQTAKTINASGGTCDYHVGDVTNIEDCQRIVSAVFDKYSRIDGLINNAGMSMRGTFSETTLDVFHNIININFIGAVNMTKFALPHLIASQGSILFISSLSALHGIPGIAPYGTAKMALTGFSQSLRGELIQHGVHVGVIFVGFTQNDPEKKIYSSSGELIALKRDKNNDTQLGVATSVLKALRWRKKTMYLTFAGKFVHVMYYLFPHLSEYLLHKFAMKDKRNN